MSDVFIHATGDYYARCDAADSVDLKQLVAAAVGQPVRRIGRFIQLALIGAGRCAKAANLDSNTAVYLGSGRGDLEITIEVMQALLRDGHAPKPLSFINTVSNAACYYIAQNLKLLGRSSFVCNRYFAFESMLQLAALDLRTNAVSAALIGAVDVVVPPLSEHRARLGLAPDAAVADASHWLCLRNTAVGAIARLLAVENFADRESLDTWLQSQHFDACLLSGGQFLANDELQQFAFTSSFEYRAERAYYDCQSGAVVSEYLRDGRLSTHQLLHINRDPSGRYGIMWIAKP